VGKVTVEIDAKWAKIVRAPLMRIVSSLQGVAISFAPLFLYFSGKGMFFPGSQWFIVPLCFAIILLVGFFYLRLGGEVVAELRKRSGA
jgi:hypothetical protein